jgi:lipopolysaccharide transport system permease protein
MLDQPMPAGAATGSVPETRYIFDAAQPRRRETALADLATGLRRWRLPVALARLDIRNRYRGSVLGPFWLTLSTAAMVGGLGLLYSSLFKLSLAEYLPFLAVSLIVWGTINQIVTDACTSLTSAEGIIRQMPLPYSVHVLRCVFRNAVIAAHSLPIILVVFLVTGTWPGPEALLAIPGLLLIALNACIVALFLGMLCARFRDIPPIVAGAVEAGAARRAAGLAAVQPLLHADGDGARAAGRGGCGARRLALGGGLHRAAGGGGAGLLHPLPRPHRVLGLAACRISWPRR